MSKTIKFPENDPSIEFEKFLNPKKVLGNLTFASLYLVSFEFLKSALVDNIKQFFNNTTKYKKELESCSPNNKNEFLACAQWHLNMKAILLEDLETIKILKEERNKIAHELPSYIIDPEINVRPELLHEALKIICKIDRWWIINVDLTCDENFDNKEINPEDVSSGRIMCLQYIINSYLSAKIETTT